MPSSVENEFLEHNENNKWNEIFKIMKNESSLVSIDLPYSVGEARSLSNRQKNRYRDVSPYDHSRVVLQKKDSESDYINASLVEIKEADRRYILTQGPLESTCGDFWLMVWQQKSRAVVMLNRIIEKGTVKCAQYWPLGVSQGDEDDMVFEDEGLMVTLLAEQDYGNFTQRWMEIEDINTGDKREVLHFHYTTWPDFGVPTSPTAFLNFLNVVRDAGCLDSDIGPAVIHCSAGIGRSGTFCLVDSCLVLIEKHGNLNCINMRQMLISMRTYRMGLIQTPDQLRFSYECVIQGGYVILGQEDKDANSNIKSHEASPVKKRDEAPPAPPRVTSLPGYRKSSASEDDMANIDEELRALIDDDDEAPPELPPKKGTPIDYEDMLPFKFGKDDEDEEEQENLYKVRQRIRTERKQATQERIKNMKDRQRKSETWKRRRSYIQPICVGLAILVGSYIVYRFYLTD